VRRAKIEEFREAFPSLAAVLELIRNLTVLRSLFLGASP